MIRKVAILGSMIVSLSTYALAGPIHNNPHPYHPHHAYKGESSFIAPAPQPVSPHFVFGGGAYVGFDLGLRTNYSSTPNVYKGVEGTLLGGFGYLAQNGLYIAEEIFVGDGIQLQAYTDDNQAQPGIKTSWSVGLSILPGYLILDNVLAYGRLGVVKTYFSNAGGNANGGQVGLGLQIAMSEHFDLRGEYTYSFYSSPSSSCASPPDSSVKADQFNVGLIYKIM